MKVNGEEGTLEEIIYERRRRMEGDRVWERRTFRESDRKGEDEYGGDSK